MSLLDKVLDEIYLYYPQNLLYDDPRYHASCQFKRKLDKKKACKSINSVKFVVNEIFSGYEVVDWTDLDLYNDYEYRVLLHRNQQILDDDTDLMLALGGRRLDLFLFISAFSNYYYFFINETEITNDGDWLFREFTMYTKEMKQLILQMRFQLSKYGYVEIDSKIANTIVENVETELKEIGRATVFDCLFTDIIPIPKN